MIEFLMFISLVLIFGVAVLLVRSKTQRKQIDFILDFIQVLNEEAERDFEDFKDKVMNDEDTFDGHINDDDREELVKQTNIENANHIFRNKMFIFLN